MQKRKGGFYEHGHPEGKKKTLNNKEKEKKTKIYNVRAGKRPATPSGGEGSDLDQKGNRAGAGSKKTVRRAKHIQFAASKKGSKPIS